MQNLNPGVPTKEPSNAAWVGRMLSNRFELTALLGKGATATVYRAVDHENQQEVAIKLLAPLGPAHVGHLKRFKREAEVLSKLRHPNIVGLVAYGEIENITHFIAMEYVAGENLETILERRSKHGLPLKEALNYIVEVAVGLAAAHKHGIVHRDIKPANVLVRSTGEVKLADFGIAREIDQSMLLSQPGEILGSPYYMSPEQRLGFAMGQTPNYDHRSDIYSLGLLAYTLVVGVPPFFNDENDFARLVTLHAMTPIPPCNQAIGCNEGGHVAKKREPGSIPQWYDRMIEIATAKKPADRFDSVDKLIDFIRTSQQREHNVFRRALSRCAAFVS